MSKKGGEVVGFKHSPTQNDEETLQRVIIGEVRSFILGKFLSGDDITRESLVLEASLNDEELTQLNFSQRVVDILSGQIQDDDVLDPVGLKILSQKIGAIMFQEITQKLNGTQPLTEVLETLGYSHVALNFKKALYFSKDFSFIVRYMVQQELGNINQSEFFYFLEDDKKSIADLGEDEDAIVDAIEEMFIDKFSEKLFDLTNILNLGLSGFNRDLLERAKGQVKDDNEIIRI